MTPRYLVECRLGPTGWLGSVELGDGQHSLATGQTKTELLERLAGIVARREGLPRASFELLERKKPSRAPRSIRPASLRAGPVERASFAKWFERWLGAVSTSRRGLISARRG